LAIPLHFDHVKLLKANLICLSCQHKSVLSSARNILVKASGISNNRTYEIYFEEVAKILTHQNKFLKTSIKFSYTDGQINFYPKRGTLTDTRKLKNPSHLL